MWLATQISEVLNEDHEELLDRLLALAPDCSMAPGDDACVLLPLTRVYGYWSLHELAAGPHTTPNHSFLRKLEELAREFDLNFLCAPTAPWALWLFKHHAPTCLLEMWDSERTRKALHKSSPLELPALLPDLLARSEARAELHFFTETLLELGLRDIETLLCLPGEELALRFGSLVRPLLKRLRGSDDLPLSWYQAPLRLERVFHPRLDRMIDAEESLDPLERLQATLMNWEKRLAARKMQLKGLRLRVRSGEASEVIFVSLPRPSREVRTLFPILREKWLHLAQNTATSFFEDELDEVALESLGLEAESDRQTDLFDPHREERSEAWNALIGRIQAKATTREPVRVGLWRPMESYLPENSMEWVEWAEDLRPPMIQDHPRRPTWLLKVPLPLASMPQPHAFPKIASEPEFYRVLEAEGALSTLERITDLWDGSGKAQDRSYARLRGQWVFWDHTRRRAFVHGYFEEAPAQPTLPNAS